VTEPAATGPALQHLVVRYAKRGKMRFASHRDVARAFERGMRRAGLPIAYSAGFTPHPKISYAGGAPTGVASEAEYLSLTLTSRRAAAQVRQRLNAALPEGIDVIDVTEGGLRADTSFGNLEASEWRVVLPGVEPAAAKQAADGFLALGEAPVERLTDKGVRHLDARAAVLEIDVLDADGGVSSGGRTPKPPQTLPRPGESIPPDSPSEGRSRRTSPRPEGSLPYGKGRSLQPGTPRGREDLSLRIPLGPSGPPEAANPDDGQRAVVTGIEDCAILRMVVLHTAPAVRPEDVLTALRERHGLVPSSPPMTTRLAQGPRALLAGTDVLWTALLWRRGATT
jgi:radical SAM-linked protein